ncbi:hypothetical protein jhhlp_004428 [Lomentospora prolificans]|uniref:adenosylmethionine decarboxylase n=1 Tax=Lomentospora prolificans TaxID=41688 RepID=A0A2N3NBI3_9PEZI|nr:hypothetical protein jhhlp_004428 [Lomentospora prolificans]
MVALPLPSSYSFSPSQATPHLTINHDVASDLDSTNAFEGPEKLLEVWFAPSPTSLPPGARPSGLKVVPADTWKGMLDLVNCEVLSVLESDNVDAYLLSESSMFVFPHKIILKTCGTTTLLLGLQRLLHIAAVDAGFPFHNAKSVTEIKAAATPYRFFYSRKNFLFPDKQRGPHRSWKQEVKFLDDIFEGGSAYMVGKMNGDHWYLYLTAPSFALTPPRTPDEEIPEVLTDVTRVTKIPAGTTTFVPSSSEDVNDETLEILMTDLDPENAKQFYLSHASAVASEKDAAPSQNDAATSDSDLGETVDVFSNGCESDLHDHAKAGSEAPTTTEGHALGTVVSENSGLSSIYPNSVYPDARIDAYMFSPCGFSANGVVPAPKRAKEGGENNGAATSSAAHYFTVHVTPEPNCSFASFETNVPGEPTGRSTSEIIEHVVNIFKPGRFSVTLFEGSGKGENALNHDENWASNRRKHLTRRIDPVRGYRRVERIVHEFDDYDLVFRFYEREGWNGAVGTRVGEDD